MSPRAQRFLTDGSMRARFPWVDRGHAKRRNPWVLAHPCITTDTKLRHEYRTHSCSGRFRWQQRGGIFLWAGRRLAHRRAAPRRFLVMDADRRPDQYRARTSDEDRMGALD